MLIESATSSTALLEGQRAALRAATDGAPLVEVLEMLVHTLEQNAARPVLASILLLSRDGTHLREGAAPSLPAEYNAAIDGIRTGPDVGSCGTAAFTGKPVIVADIQTDPLWKEFRGLAAKHGLRACWSIPFFSMKKRVLGTFAIYHREPATPAVEDFDLVNMLSQTASVVVEGAAHAADAKDERASAPPVSRGEKPTNVSEHAREKIASILGPVAALRLYNEVIAEIGGKLETPDDLLRFGDNLSARKGFEGVVGAMLSVSAVMQGAKRG